MFMLEQRASSGENGMKNDYGHIGGKDDLLPCLNIWTFLFIVC